MIVKTSFKDQVRELLLKKMRSGNLKPGITLSLAELSREMGVSVTPIREACSQLESSGIIQSVVNRGFIVPELCHKQASELYELIAILESTAISASKFTDQHIKTLKKHQRIFEQKKNGIDRINADIDFHQVLISAFENSVVQNLVAELKVRIFFYEVEFMQDSQFHSDSECHHTDIIKCIESGEVDQAAEIVKHNWLQILKYMKK